MSEASIQLVLESVRALQSGLGEWQAAFTARQDATNQRLDAIASRQDASDQRLEAIERRLDDHDQRFVELRTELHQVRANIMDRIDRLSDEFNAVREDITVNFGRADRAERIAKSTETEGHAAWEQIRAIERMVHKLAGRMADLERRYDQNGHNGGAA